MNEVLIGVGSTAFLLWAGWVSITLVRNFNNPEDVKDLKKAFGEMEDRVTKELEKINLRHDTFIKAEVETLKALLHKD